MPKLPKRYISVINKLLPTKVHVVLALFTLLELSYVSLMQANRRETQATLGAKTIKPTPTTALKILTPTPTPKITTKKTPTPTPTVKLTPTPGQTAAVVTSKLFGVNISGAEFGADGTVGTINKDYIYQTNVSSYTYYKSKNQTIVRIPFRWERVQSAAMGSLSTTDVAGIRSMMDAAQAAGLKVILDLHNYARYYNTPMTVADAPKLADVWVKLVGALKDHPALYGYEIMNEPHDLPDGSSGWAQIAQMVTNAIRQSDTSHYILIPGYGWQSAADWQSNNGSLNISDPAGKLLYSAHEYFDSDNTGTYKSTACTDMNIGTARLSNFTGWLSSHNAQGIITEFGSPGDSCWLTIMDSFLQAVNSSPNLVGATVWAGGPWWGSYPLSVEPSGTTDKPQMQVLQKY